MITPFEALEPYKAADEPFKMFMLPISFGSRLEIPVE
jgi:hypothetical protein